MNIVTGDPGMGLVASRDIQEGELIVIFSNAIILEDCSRDQEFTSIIKAYNIEHRTQGSQIGCVGKL